MSPLRIWSALLFATLALLFVASNHNRIQPAVLLAKPNRNTLELADLKIVTSFRKKELSVKVTLEGIRSNPPSDGEAVVLDSQGKEVKRFALSVTTDNAGRHVLKATQPWQDLPLWDFQKPNLYTLRITVKTDSDTAQIDEVFGFRELWTEGKRILLNGIPLKLRAVPYSSLSDPNEAIAKGYNLIIRPETGSAESLESWLRKADRAGVLVSVSLPEFNPKATSTENEPSDWLMQTRESLSRVANHPSVCFLELPLFKPPPNSRNPLLLGNRKADASAEISMAYQRLQAIASSQLIYIPEGGAVGDICAFSLDPMPLPLQEREDFLNEWFSKGDMPLIVVPPRSLHSTPLFRGRLNYPDNLSTEPFVTEYAAAQLGNEAYLQEPEAYRKGYTERFLSDQQYQTDQNPDASLENPTFAKVYMATLSTLWKAWRLQGISGGGLSVASNVPQLTSATAAYIAGPKDAPTAKTHSYHVDSTIEKQMVLFNDTRQTQNYRFQWEARLSTKTLKIGKGTGELAPGEMRSFQIRFVTPFFNNGKVNGEIRLNALIGTTKHEEKFAYRVFSRRYRSGRFKPIAVFDPLAKSSDLLPLMEYSARNWSGQMNVPILLIGRGALTSGRSLPGNLEAYVRRGGRVVIFGQQSEWYSKTLGLRIAPYLTRQVFPLVNGHAYLGELDRQDFENWRGPSLLIKELTQDQEIEAARLYGARAGSRGTVASVPMEKPHYGSMRPLLETEFDLAYAPLLEMEYGKGRIILCTLDLEDHAVTDPAAERAFFRLIDYALKSYIPPKSQRTLYFGGSTDAEHLNSMGVIFETVGTSEATTQSLSGTNAADVVILGRDGNISPETMARFLAKGGRLLFLPRDERNGTGYQPKLKTTTLPAIPTVPTWNVCRGLSVSDLRRRANVEAAVLTEIPPIRSGTAVAKTYIGADGQLGLLKLGKGAAVFCQIAPNTLDTDQKTYLRLTRWRQTRAVSQLLANLGVGFKQDEACLKAIQSGSATNSLNLYHPDYRSDYPLGDSPYRYYFWR